MATTVSFIHEKDGEFTQTIHGTENVAFHRDDLTNKFGKFMETVGYCFPEDEQSTGEEPGPFEME